MQWNEGGRPAHLTFAGLRGGGKGGGKTTSTTDTSSSVQLPSWLDAASQQAINQATDLSQRPYTPYGGQVVADPTQMTQQAYAQTQAAQGQFDPAYQQAAGQWGGVLGNLQSLTPQQQQAMTNQFMGGYGANVMAPAAGLLGGYMQQGPATAGQVTQNALDIMSPFSQAVINPALQIGQQQLRQNLQNIGAGANQAGAFGGTRQGVQEGVAQSQAAVGAGQMVGNLLNQGWQEALTPATQVALQGGQQGYGAATNLAGMLGTGYGSAAQQAQSMLGTNLGLGTQAAQQIPALAGAQQTADQQQTAILQAAGQQQQQQQQQQLNAQMSQFYQQQDWPVQNLDVLLSAVGGVPYGYSSTGTTQQQQQMQSNPLSGALGGAASLAGIAGSMGMGPLGVGMMAAGGGLLGGLG
jgi:hypothetical protein